MAKTKYVYFFGAGKAEGKGTQKNLLGGKGANLAEMAGHPKLKLPVPPGFTVSTDVCTYYYDNGRRYPSELKAQVNAAIRKTEAPILIVHGLDDDFVIPESAPLLYDAAPGPAELWQPEGVGHSDLWEVKPEAYQERAFDWFDRF